jgi:hypothetical protein
MNAMNHNQGEIMIDTLIFTKKYSQKNNTLIKYTIRKINGICIYFYLIQNGKIP